MAPYFNLYDDEDDEKQEVSPTVRLSSASGNQMGPSGSEASTQAPGQPLKTGSGFQNLDSYIQANRGQGFGNQFLGKVQESVNSAERGQRQAVQDFTQQVNDLNPIPAPEQITQSVQNPTPENAGAYQGWMNQQFKGPRQLPENQNAYQQYYGGISKAKTQADLLRTEPGRFTLLDSFFGRPGYQHGEKSLDNALVQQSDLAEPTLSLQAQAQGLQTRAAEDEDSLRQLTGTKAGQIAESRNLARSQIGVNDQNQIIQGDGAGALGNLQAQVTGALTDKNRERKEYQDWIREKLQSQNFPRSIATELGVNAGTPTYNLNLEDYLTAHPDLTHSQVMTPEQRTKLSALNQMAGIQDPFASGETVDVPPAFGFDAARLNADVAQKERELDDKYLEYHRQRNGHYSNPIFQTPQALAYAQLHSPLDQQKEIARRFVKGAFSPQNAEYNKSQNLPAYAELSKVLSAYGLTPEFESSKKIGIF